MAFGLARILGWTSIALGVVVYVAALAGVLFAAPTAPLDVGAASVLGIGLLFGALALALGRQPA